jgi:hypothetical protein
MNGSLKPFAASIMPAAVQRRWVYDRAVVPLARAIETIPPPFGKNLIAVARRREQHLRQRSWKNNRRLS